MEADCNIALRDPPYPFLDLYLKKNTSMDWLYCGRVHKENPLVKYLWVTAPDAF
jgi:hypothetical protein